MSAKTLRDLTYALQIRAPYQHQRMTHFNEVKRVELAPCLLQRSIHHVQLPVTAFGQAIIVRHHQERFFSIARQLEQ